MNFLGNVAPLFNALGLNSLAKQDAAAVAITGGTITGLSSLAVTGGISTTGSIVTGAESRFANGSFNDPVPGAQYDAKFGGLGNGIVVRGASNFLGAMTVGGTLTTQSDVIVGSALYSSQVKLGFNMSGGGVITFDANGNFSWTSRFIAMNLSRGATFATSGYYDITMPGSGAVVTGYNGASNYTMTSNAIIPIGTWQALYYAPPLSAASGSQAAGFALVGYGSGSFVVPPHWILLAQRNSDQNRLHVLAGRYILAPGDSLDTGLYRTGNFMPGNFTIQSALTTGGNVSIGGTLTVANTTLWSSANVTTSLGTSGYRITPDGFIEQWGSGVTGNDGTITFTFPVTFPSRSNGFVPTPMTGGSAYYATVNQIGTNNQSSAVVTCFNPSGSPVANVTVRYRVWGY